jgi:hypothetical protein
VLPGRDKRRGASQDGLTQRDGRGRCVTGALSGRSQSGTAVAFMPQIAASAASNRWHQHCSEEAMSLLTILLVIVVVGVLLWAINSFIPMDGKIKSILNIVVVIALIIWLLQAFGVIGALSGVRVD